MLIADYEQIVRETTRLAGGEQECLKVGFLRCYSAGIKKYAMYPCVIGCGKGFMPSEGTPIEGSLGTNIVRIPLYRGYEPVKRNYCVFWKKENKRYI